MWSSVGLLCVKEPHRISGLGASTIRLGGSVSKGFEKVSRQDSMVRLKAATLTSSGAKSELQAAPDGLGFRV